MCGTLRYPASQITPAFLKKTWQKTLNSRSLLAWFMLLVSTSHIIFVILTDKRKKHLSERKGVFDIVIILLRSF